MKVYHGSYMEIPKPNITFSRENLDFGKGFYLTPLEEQARRWASRFKKKYDSSIVNIYELSTLSLDKNFIIKQFDSYDEEWLDYILACRNGRNPINCDIVSGGVANDKVFNTIELYFDGLIDKTEAIRRLKYEKPNLQICILNQYILDNYLVFLESEAIL